MSWEKVTGTRNKGDIKLYALSTCIWCKKAKKLIDDADVGYQYIYADKLDDKGKMKIIMEMNEHIDNVSFPLVVIDDDVVIEGYDEEELKEVLYG